MVGTIGPEEHAIATTSLAITQVLSLKTGRFIGARELIERPTYEWLMRIRRILKETLIRNEKRVVCSMCGTPVYLVAKAERTFFFRHSYEDGSCSAITRSELSERDIEAMKYLGVRESPAHRSTKRNVERSLLADAAFSDIEVEKRWTSERRPASYRQPDVQARRGKTRLAFEVQLSTTFLHVVVGRREFYRGENAMLIWVLRSFDPESRRMTIDDILFNNNSNILVVDDETAKLSEEQAAFVARCWFREPYLEEGDVRYRWSNKLVKVREMTFDVDRQHAFGFDVRGRKRELLRELEEQAERDRRKPLDDARELFFRFCEFRGSYPDYMDREIDFYDSTEPLRDLSVPMPETLGEASTFIQQVLALRSIQLGKPVGYRYDKLIQVLHTMAESYKDFLYYIGYALKVYGRNELVAQQDPNRRWAKRSEAIKASMIADDPAYEPTMEWAEAFVILFPEMVTVPKWAALPPLVLSFDQSLENFE